MSLEDRMAFREAKMKELQSFFDNSVWQFDQGQGVPEDRILKAKFILGWKKNPDGSPRAKARLVVQGFRDPDALNGSLSTTSPTLTRLSRGLILTVATMLGMEPFTSDVSTAFLQGKGFKADGTREIWVRLPKDAETILGIERDSGKLMKLVKPIYGLCDAPRAWYEEATERFLKIGKGSIIQHPLDACLFLAFDQDPHQAHALGVEPQLIGMFGMHVDDLFGCLMPNNEYATQLQKSLKEVFSFREWLNGDHLEYCGCQVDKVNNNHWRLHQEKYLHKQKPTRAWLRHPI